MDKGCRSGFTLIELLIVIAAIRRRHGNGVLNGAFLDGHARAIPDPEWNRVSQDTRGYFYALAAADR